MVDSNGDKLIALMVNLSNMPKLENGKLTNVISSSYAKVQKAYKINSSNALTQIPLWVANCYEAEDYTEKEVIMKSADGGNKYSKDSDFVNDCFVWAGLTNKNKCISDQSIKNQYCFKQSTYADDFLKTLKLSDEAKALLIDWESLLNYAKTTDEYISLNNYGLHQIERELNIKIGTGTFTKTGVEIKAPKYRKLDENISSFKDKLKEFYLTKLKKKLFKYELLK